MTESQNLPKGPRQVATAPASPEQEAEQSGELPSREVEIDGKTFTVVELPDGLSWNLFGSAGHGGVPAPRLAQITVSEQGYFSIDRVGEVRGPYTTLDEAAYPLGTADPALLADPPPLGSQSGGGSSSSSGASQLSGGPIVSVLTVAAVLATAGLLASLWLLVRQRSAGASTVVVARPVALGRPPRR